LAFLRPFLDDGSVTDLFVNGDRGLFIDRGRGIECVASWRASELEVRRLAVRLIALGGRHLDDASPCVDVRLERGVRVHVVLAPVAVGGMSVSVRVPRWDAPDRVGLERGGMFTATQRARPEDMINKGPSRSAVCQVCAHTELEASTEALESGTAVAVAKPTTCADAPTSVPRRGGSREFSPRDRPQPPEYRAGPAASGPSGPRSAAAPERRTRVSYTPHRSTSRACSWPRMAARIRHTSPSSRRHRTLHRPELRRPLAPNSVPGADPPRTEAFDALTP